MQSVNSFDPFDPYSSQPQQNGQQHSNVPDALSVSTAGTPHSAFPLNSMQSSVESPITTQSSVQSPMQGSVQSPVQSPGINQTLSNEFGDFMSAPPGSPPPPVPSSPMLSPQQTSPYAQSHQHQLQQQPGMPQNGTSQSQSYENHSVSMVQQQQHQNGISQQYSYENHIVSVQQVPIQLKPQPPSVPTPAPAPSPRRPPAHPSFSNRQPPLPEQRMSASNQEAQAQGQSPLYSQTVPMKKRASSSSMSSARSSISGRSGYAESVLSDKSFAPPPPFPKSISLVKMQYLNTKVQEVASTLPDYSDVKHSGELLARFSLKSMLIKKWRPTFWIAFGKHQILFFRSRSDFEEWVSNPFLRMDDRNALVKLTVDFKNDLYKPGIKLYGYGPTGIKTKGYSREGQMFHFKLERWYSYGPSVLAAFGGKNTYEVRALHRIIAEMVRKAEYNIKNYDSDASRSSLQGSENLDGYGSDARSYQSGADHNSVYDSGISTKSAPMRNRADSAYSEMLLESGSSFGGGYGGPQMVGAEPSANDEINRFRSNENGPMNAQIDLSGGVSANGISANSNGMIRTQSWKDKLKLKKFGSKKDGPVDPNYSNHQDPRQAQGEKKTEGGSRWRNIGQAIDRARSQSVDRRVGDAKPLGKKRSFRFGKKKQNEEDVQYYVGRPSNMTASQQQQNPNWGNF